jgi:hypothetical protein
VLEDRSLSVSLREAGATPGIYILSVRSASLIVAGRVVLVEKASSLGKLQAARIGQPVFPWVRLTKADRFVVFL